MNPSEDHIRTPGRAPASTALLQVLPPLLVSLALLALCIRHALREPFWIDEIYTYLLLSDPSPSHMLAANRDIINTVPPLYFLLGWGWAQAFGLSAPSLRLFSSVAVCGAVWLTWSLLRRRFTYLPSALALCIVFLEGEVLSQNRQVRFYALYLLFCALAIWQYDTLHRKRAAGAPAGKDYAATTLCHLLLVFTHSFGLLVSGCVLLADVLLSWRCYGVSLKRLDGRLIGAVVLAWLVFAVVWGPSQLHHLSAFRPYSWVPKPTPFNYFVSFFGSSLEIMATFVVSLLAAGLGYRLWTRGGNRNNSEKYRQPQSTTGPVLNVRDPIVLLSVLLLVIPITVIYAISILGTSCFLQRYMVYGHIAWAVVLAAGFHIGLSGLQHAGGSTLFAALNTFPLSPEPRAARATAGLRLLAFGFAVAAFLVLATFVGRTARAGQVFEKPHQKLEARLAQAGVPADLPVVTVLVHTYMDCTFYAPRPSRYYYVLDRDYALKAGPGTAWFWVMNLIQEAVQRQYPDPNQQTWGAFLAAHPRFVIYDNDSHGSPRWSEYRTKNLAGYRVTAAPSPEPGTLVLLVEKNP